ncbi:MAG: hypothetical protein ACPLX8_00655 [Nanopusillaceae archaeon]
MVNNLETKIKKLEESIITRNIIPIFETNNHITIIVLPNKNSNNISNLIENTKLLSNLYKSSCTNMYIILKKEEETYLNHILNHLAREYRLLKAYAMEDINSGEAYKILYFSNCNKNNE